MNFLGMGPAELLLVLALALIVFGPDKLPDLARQIGRVVGEFRRVSSDVTREMQRSLQEEAPNPGPRIVRQSPPSGPKPVQPAAPAPAAEPVPPASESGSDGNAILPPTSPAASVPPSGSWEDGPKTPPADPSRESGRTA